MVFRKNGCDMRHIKEFRGLISEKLIKALKIVGIEKLNPLQEESLYKILSGINVLIIAPTGSGKTEAAMIPIFEKILQEGGRALYITPLRALNRDMYRRLVEIGKSLGIYVDLRHGDTPQHIRRKQSETFPDILITTPETFQLLFVGKNLRKMLFDVKYVIVDEIHELIDNDRGLQLTIALERLDEYSKGYQRIGLSATIANKEEAAKFLTGKRSCEIIEWEPERSIEIRVNPLFGKYSQKYHEIIFEKRVMKRLLDLMRDYKTMLVFTNTRSEAEILGAHALDYSDIVKVHHGSLSRAVRESVEFSLRDGNAKVVICTSSLELGIDIGHIEYVIQINSPRQVTRLLQRVGRSGHKLTARPKGEVICSNLRETIEALATVDLLHEKFLEFEQIRHNGLLPIMNQIIAYSIENNGVFDPEYFYWIIKRAHPYKDIPEELYKKCINFLISVGYLQEYDGQIKLTRKGRMYFYENISMIVDETKYNVMDIETRRIIGTLDSDFVYTFKEDEVIILGGVPWQVIEVDHEKLLVKVSKNIFVENSTLPKWLGENIPVSKEVAQRVLKYITNRDIPEVYIFSDNTERIIKEVAKIGESISHITENTILEYVDAENLRSLGQPYTANVIVLYTFLGHKANAALSTIFRAALKHVGILETDVKFNAYGVYALIPLRYTYNYMKNIILPGLFSRSFEELKDDVQGEIVHVFEFQKIFNNVLRKLGLKPLREISNVPKFIKRSLEKNSLFEVVYLEAMSKFLFEKSDFNVAKKFWNTLNGKPIQFVKGPTKAFKEFILVDISTTRQATTDETILQAFRDSIETRRLYLICINPKCGYVEETSVREILEVGKPVSRCPICGAIRGVSKSRTSILTVSNAQRRALEDSARLLSEFGYKALLCFATKGVGVKTAKNILSKYGYSDYLLIRELLKAYQNYVRTRIFWHD